MDNGLWMESVVDDWLVKVYSEFKIASECEDVNEVLVIVAVITASEMGMV
jgi:hypothetical protein